MSNDYDLGFWIATLGIGFCLSPFIILGVAIMASIAVDAEKSFLLILAGCMSGFVLISIGFYLVTDPFNCETVE